MNAEVIHNEHHAVTEYEQDYRISTIVRFFASGTFKCEARLYKSNGGKVQGEAFYDTYNRVNDEDIVEQELQKCVDKCYDKIEEIERAKLLDIDVNYK